MSTSSQKPQQRISTIVNIQEDSQPPKQRIKKITDTSHKDIPQKEMLSRRRIARPSQKETYFWINTILISLVTICFLSANLIQKTSSHTSNILYQYIIPFFLISIPVFLGLYIRYRLISSIVYRDGMIKRLLKELHLKTKDTDHHGKQLKHLIESTNVCPWSADLHRNCFTYVGPQIVSITDIPNDDWLSKGFLTEHVIPTDRKMLFAAFKNLKTGGFTTLEYRVRAGDGRILWLRNSFCLVDYHDEQNKQPDKTVQGFITDITEQKKVEEALYEARYAAENASRTKSNFLASMSHELRTPLNSIIGFSEIMRNQVFGNIGEQYKEYADNIFSSGKHLLDLINDILDFSKIEAGKFDVIKEATDLREIFRSCEMLLRERASRSELALKIFMPSEPLYIEVDCKRMKQVLINLLSNSIKFTKSGGTIALEYDISENDELILLVKDTGIGIKPEDIGTVFEKFHQVDAEKNRNQEGTGLGLSISKSLVEMHDGEFFLDSIYGHGTTIKLVFPKKIFYVPKAKPKDIQQEQAEITNALKGSSFYKNKAS